MPLTVEHKLLRHLEILFGHQPYLHLILYFLHSHSVREPHMGEYCREVVVCRECPDRKKCFPDCVLNLIDRKRHMLAVALDDVNF